ncbi:microcystin-dependent protein [Paucibacter oligotrophus]|uniref:Microcystin-dependent protein n=1 Tax=Roseateles oligotrophus TaxID=1769250 RepID=A0A840L7P8_9BURK|nr:tail fiber protein [Roseateles oligotrophus]MBB4842248.1 microcystin-dependent protein [Roseateles oligotrophus]
MSEPFLGQISIISFNYPPRGWAFCNGQLLPINQNQALFSILGTTYGGDGRSTFALPDLRGRVPRYSSNTWPLGSRAGEEAHSLSNQEMPQHQHALQASSDLANASVPGLAVPAAKARGGRDIYAPPASSVGPLNPAAVTTAGGGQAHTNMQPYLTLNFVIALQGIFPSRN